MYFVYAIEGFFKIQAGDIAITHPHHPSVTFIYRTFVIREKIPKIRQGLSVRLYLLIKSSQAELLWQPLLRDCSHPAFQEYV
jgi:hypothetical protein